MSRKEMKKVFVIIVTYKGKRWYDKCFSSLRESTIPVQTVAVDNTPGNEDVEYIKTHFPEVHVIKTNENLGFGRANNLGMRYALDNECDYVFLLNQDAWIESDAIEKLIPISEKYPEYGIISPIHMNASKTAINMGLVIEEGEIKLLSDIYTNQVGDVYETKYINAAAWLLPRKTLETIGGFCPIIFQYGEDDDYINRVLYHGFKVGLVPNSRIVHDSGQKLSESYAHANRATHDNIDALLNINNNITTSKLRLHFAWRIFLSWIRRKRRAYNKYKHSYSILCKNQKKIDECLLAHKIKQANWL